jgi:hypothetical protein
MPPLVVPARDAQPLEGNQDELMQGDKSVAELNRWELACILAGVTVSAPEPYTTYNEQHLQLRRDSAFIHFVQLDTEVLRGILREYMATENMLEDVKWWPKR